MHKDITTICLIQFADPYPLFGYSGMDGLFFKSDAV